MVHSAFSTKGQLHTLIFRNSSVWDLYPDSRISSERCAAFYLFILNLSFCNLIPTVHGDLGLLIWIFQCGALAADLTIGIVPTTCWPLSIYSYVHTNQISCSPFRSSPDGQHQLLCSRTSIASYLHSEEWPSKWASASIAIDVFWGVAGKRNMHLHQAQRPGAVFLCRILYLHLLIGRTVCISMSRAAHDGSRSIDHRTVGTASLPLGSPKCS